MLKYGIVPDDFRSTYSVPIPESKLNVWKPLSIDDFRSISISPVLSKVFEHCVLDRFDSFFKSSDHQFQFKNELGCPHAVYSVRKIVNYYIAVKKVKVK